MGTVALLSWRLDPLQIPPTMLPKYPHWQMAVILASPPRNSALGLACLLWREKQGPNAGLSGAPLPAATAQGQRMLGGCQGMWAISYTAGLQGARGTRVHILSHRLWLQQEHPVRCRSAMPHSEHHANTHSSHIHCRMAPGAAAGGGPLSCPAGWMASPLPPHMLGWRGHVERCPPKPPRQIFWPLLACATAKADRGIPTSCPLPLLNSYRMTWVLQFTLGNKAQRQQMLPIYSPQHCSCLSGCPLQPKEAGRGQPISKDL